jgi:hypothetical protein
MVILSLAEDGMTRAQKIVLVSKVLAFQSAERHKIKASKEYAIDMHKYFAVNAQLMLEYVGEL